MRPIKPPAGWSPPSSNSQPMVISHRLSLSQPKEQVMSWPPRAKYYLGSQARGGRTTNRPAKLLEPPAMLRPQLSLLRKLEQILTINREKAPIVVKTHQPPMAPQLRETPKPMVLLPTWEELQIFRATAISQPRVLLKPELASQGALLVAVRHQRARVALTRQETQVESLTARSLWSRKLSMLMDKPHIKMGKQVALSPTCRPRDRLGARTRCQWGRQGPSLSRWRSLSMTWTLLHRNTTMPRSKIKMKSCYLGIKMAWHLTDNQKFRTKLWALRSENTKAITMFTSIYSSASQRRSLRLPGRRMGSQSVCLTCLLTRAQLREKWKSNLILIKLAIQRTVYKIIHCVL